MTSTGAPTRSTLDAEHRDGELWIIAGQIALVVAIVLGFGATLDFGPKQQLGLIFIPVAAMLVLAPPRRYLRLVLSVPVLLYVSWWTLSVTWTTNTGGFVVDSQIPLFVTAALIVLVCYLPLRSFTKGLVVASYVTIVWTILYTGLNPDIAMINDDGVPGWRGGFIHKNGLAPFMLFAALTIALFESHRVRRVVGIAAALFFVVMAQSTTSLIAGSSMLAAWWGVRALARVPVQRRGQLVVIGGLLGLCVVALTMSWLPSVVTAFGKDPTLTSRTDIWVGVIDAIAERPVQGYGIGGVWIDQAAPQTRAIQQRLGFVVFHSHNGFLEIALHLGLVGLALFAILLISTGRRAVGLLDSERRLATYALMFITLVLVTSISEVTTFGMWFGMLGALATLIARIVADDRRRALETRGRIRGGAVLLAASMLVTSCTNAAQDESIEPSTTPGAVSPPDALTADPSIPDSGYLWSVLPIGGGGWATGIVMHESEPGVAYARTDVSGAYRYDAESDSWVQMLTAGSLVDGSLQPDDYVVESVAVAPSDPDIVYLSVGNDEAGADATGGSGRVLSSTDGGRTWRSGDRRWIVAGNAHHRQRSERLAVDPRDAERVVLGTRLDGLWRSDDAGRTWTELDDAPRGRSTSDDAAPGITFVTWGSGEHEDHLWAGVAGEGVFASRDAGSTWEEIWSENDPGVAPFEGAYSDGRLLVAFNQISGDGDGDGAIRRLDVATGEWVDVTPSHRAPDWSVAVSPHDRDRMVAAPDAVRDGLLWRTADGGRTWSALDSTMRSREVPWVSGNDDDWMFIGRLRFDPHHVDRLWFAEGRGIWTADDVFAGSAVVWDARLAGLEQTVTADLVVNPDGDPVSAVADHQGFLHRALDEYPVSPLVDHRFAGGTSLDHSAGTPEHLVWIGAEYQRYHDPARVGRGAVSSDGGVTWAELPNLTPDHFGGNIAMSATDPDNLVWVPSYSHPFEYDDEPRGLFVTDDGGDRWTHLDQGVDGSHRFHRLVWWMTRRAIAADRVEGGTFYLNDDDGNFWVSTDGGFEWRSAPHAAPCFEHNDCHVFGQLRASPTTASEVWASVGTDGLQRTADAGQSRWESFPDVVEARSFDFGAPLPGSTAPTIFLHGRVGSDPDLGVWRSSDLGDSWQLVTRYPAGLARGITVVAADPRVPGRVYLGTPGTGFVYGDDAEVGR